MNDGTPVNAGRFSGTGAGAGSGSQQQQQQQQRRRRSPRLSAAAANSDDKMVAVKRSFAVRKIEPRRTAAPDRNHEEDKENTENRENTPRRSVPVPVPGAKPRVSTPGRSRRSAPVEEKKEEKKRSMPSPILAEPPDAAWSRKVRRSYSRLSDPELRGTGSRDTMFGFERLQTPEVVRGTGLEVSASLFPLTSFTSLLEAEPPGGPLPPPEADPNIPGVALVKEKRRRRKVQPMDTTELDALAAKMNAEFQEAQEFQLVVE